MSFLKFLNRLVEIDTNNHFVFDLSALNNHAKKKQNKNIRMASIIICNAFLKTVLIIFFIIHNI